MTREIIYSKIPFTVHEIKYNDVPELLIYFSLQDSTYSNKKFIVSVKDDFYNSYIETFELTLPVNSIYWIGPAKPQLRVMSKHIIFEVTYEDNLVYSERIKLQSEPDLTLIRLIPDIMKYANQNINISVFAEVFQENQYSYKDVKINKGDIVVDIGSNIGAFVYYALYNGASKIYAVEPSPVSFSILKKHFGNYKNVDLLNYGISEKEGIVNLITSICDESSGGNFLETNEKAMKDHAESSIYIKSVPVLIKSFGNFLKENDIERIDYLKVDCEGGEYDIFIEKYIDFFVKNVKKISLEFHDGSQKILDVFRDKNFEITERQIAVGLLHLKNLNL